MIIIEKVLIVHEDEASALYHVLIERLKYVQIDAASEARVGELQFQVFLAEKIRKYLDGEV